MGEYTNLVLTVRLRKDTPSPVIEMLTAVVAGYVSMPDDPVFEHPFFKTPRWGLVCAGHDTAFSKASSVLGYDEYPNGDREYVLSVNSTMRNYDHEYEQFLDWLSAYVKPDSALAVFVGYMTAEVDASLKLIYLAPGGFWYRRLEDAYALDDLKNSLVWNKLNTK